ncbi:MAG: HD domain-containing protein [Eubacterium sp.]|nr:HD domain-containing protein [Eubacterium sp.]
MDGEKYLEILGQAARLKTNTRHCFTDAGRRESIADHSWRTALLAMLLGGEEEFRDVDMNRVIRMCLIHDLGEAFTGDIPTFDKSAQDSEREEDLLNGWVDTFPAAQREEWQSLLAEMNGQETVEARLYKALDKVEAVIAHNESDIETWLPLEYDLQLTYGKKEGAFSETLRELRAAVDEQTRAKIEAAGKEN